VSDRIAGTQSWAQSAAAAAAQDVDNQLAHIRDPVLASSALVRRIASAEEQPVQRLGRLLLEALLVGDVGGLYGARYQ